MKNKDINVITLRRLKDILSFDPATGIFTRRIRHFKNSESRPGDVAGYPLKTPCGKTYGSIFIDGKRYRLHKLAWYYAYGEYPNEIDHIDGDGFDNRLINLRPVSREENQRNLRLRKDNKSGVPGVYERTYKKHTTYIVRIHDKGKTVCIGHSQDFFEAVCIRKSAELKFNYHPNHGQERPL